jgi:hypothetical protein
MPAWIPAAIGALGSLGSSVIGNKGRKANESRARRWNLEQWHRQNKYNHPIEQMARLKSAGLNPNMIYGSSPGSAVGNAGAVAPGQAPDFKMSNFVGEGINQFFDTRVKQAQTNNLDAQAQLNSATAVLRMHDAGFRGHKMVEMNAQIAEFKRDLEKGVTPEKIKQSVTKSQADKIAMQVALAGLNRANEGFIKGDTLGNVVSGVFGLDMRNKDDREIAQIVMGIVLGSQVLGNFAKFIPGLSKYFSKNPKTPKTPKRKIKSIEFLPE